ncbi:MULTISPECIES: ABC transporter permease [unclassified Ochrobactrum]|uniref:ABC transporter permease n=1 Tax=unclassified Ochrobactrum TaxID=239106 RepID=UPI0030AD5A53
MSVDLIAIRSLHVIDKCKLSTAYSKAFVFFAKAVGLCAIAAILFFLILPTILVVPMSLSQTDYIKFPPDGFTVRWYYAYFTDPDWMSATWFSFRIAVMTTIVATIVGTMAALAIVRGDLPWKNGIQALSIGPLIVPNVVLGVALFLVFAPLQLTGSFTGFLIAHTVLAVPYVLITVMASLQRFDSELELAALNCGANRLQTFFRIVLPNIMPGIASGGVFAFLASFDEATVAFFISDTGGKTIGRKMFEDIDFNLTPVIAAASTFMIAIALVFMSIAHFMTRSASLK